MDSLRPQPPKIPAESKPDIPDIADFALAAGMPGGATGLLKRLRDQWFRLTLDDVGVLQRLSDS